jgi:hypothetical protein
VILALALAALWLRVFDWLDDRSRALMDETEARISRELESRYDVPRHAMRPNGRKAGR